MEKDPRELVIDSLHEGVYFVDRERRISYWNRGAERISGYSADRVVGCRCSDNLLRHVDAEGRELCLSGCPVTATFATEAQCEAHVYLHHADGHRVPVSVRVIPIKSSEGKVVGAAEIFTDEVLREDLLKEMEALRKENLIDTLTGIGNRRYAEIAMRERGLAR
jgi:PAS domain S-box-containing protein